MEHKFVIEVRLRHEPPQAGTQPKAPQDAVDIGPKVLQSLLAQLPHALAALQSKPNPQSDGKEKKD